MLDKFHNYNLELFKKKLFNIQKLLNIQLFKKKYKKKNGSKNTKMILIQPLTMV